MGLPGRGPGLQGRLLPSSALRGVRWVKGQSPPRRQGVEVTDTRATLSPESWEGLYPPSGAMTQSTGHSDRHTHVHRHSLHGRRSRPPPPRAARCGGGAPHACGTPPFPGSVRQGPRSSPHAQRGCCRRGHVLPPALTPAPDSENERIRVCRTWEGALPPPPSPAALVPEAERTARPVAP